MTELRKLQKSKTGYYINLPMKVIKQLNLKDTETAKIQYDKETKRIIIEFIEV